MFPQICADLLIFSPLLSVRHCFRFTQMPTFGGRKNSTLNKKANYLNNDYRAACRQAGLLRISVNQNYATTRKSVARASANLRKSAGTKTGKPIRINS